VASQERSLNRRTKLSKKDSVTIENPFLSLTLRQEIELQFQRTARASIHGGLKVAGTLSAPVCRPEPSES